MVIILGGLIVLIGLLLEVSTVKVVGFREIGIPSIPLCILPVFLGSLMIMVGIGIICVS